MSQLGARFREAREVHGLSLADAAAGTRILPRYLQALEDGAFDQLPGDVYARGFIRNYAQFLNLPADELIQLYRRERGAVTDKIRVVPAAVPPRTRSCLIPSAVVSFFSILVLLAVLYVVAQAAGLTRLPTNTAMDGLPLPTSTPQRPTATAFPTSTLQPEGTPLSPLPLGPTTTPAPAAPSNPPTATPGGPLTVEVRIAPDAPRGSWVSVTVDGQNAYTGTMLANTSRPFMAQREVFIHAGDASVVELIVNGENKGRMGTVPGGVKKTTIPVQNPNGSNP